MVHEGNPGVIAMRPDRRVDMTASVGIRSAADVAFEVFADAPVGGQDVRLVVLAVKRL